MGVDELIKIIEDNDLTKAIFHWDEEDKWSEHEEYLGDIYEDLDLSPEEGKEWLENLNLGKIEAKGNRQDTSEFWSVLYFKDHDIYLKISGWYDSYGNYDHDYNNIKEVKPQTVSTTIYN